ncbi:leucine-rich repeat domain-containing protein [Lignipirellula cremea]|uniref:Leucine Rich repeats (2 copies) n=1 Tax=Lignipirellula cremea TaxID=2528010 RepID=A0A518DM75_9BACT|nr:hypothetical protein [Lignipirellula cremea]QDU92921.1 Leucine Rich repeats (2 copies) [Lignipirellula cremea]
MTRLIACFFAAMILAKTPGLDAVAADAAPSCFLIGNSLTWDTVPERLDGDVQWHVDCGVTLPYIQGNPEKPCVQSSKLWPAALREKQYDLVSVQPHYGSTLAQDVEVISGWMALQPQAVFVLHSGWAWQDKVDAEFTSYAVPQAMEHSPVYLRALRAELQRLHPDREIRLTLAQNLLAQISADIAAGQAPWRKLSDLYRDKIHLTYDQGRYLMHNAMRRAMGQKQSAAGFDTTDAAGRAYLNSVLAMLDTAPADRQLLTKILSLDTTDRASLIGQLSDKKLQSQMTALLPEIDKAAIVRRQTLTLEKEIDLVGGKLVCTPSGPQWLYLATGDQGMEIFDVPATIDLYNGNNPLKGKGGKNEQVTDAWLPRLRGLTTLQKLDLANCAIQGDGLKNISQLTSLRELNLTLTPVADDALEHLSGLTGLRSLGLASTQCTGSGFVHLKGLRQLENVNFHYTPLNDAGLAAISQLPISDRLWFAHTHFTDQGAATLASLKQLKRCGMGSKEKDSSGEAVSALTGLPLEDLALLDNQATDTGIGYACKIPTLLRLDVSYAPTVTDAALKNVAQLPLLEEFKLGNSQITDAGLLQLAASPSLKKLTLRGSKKITPAGLDQLRKARPELTIESP